MSKIPFNDMILFTYKKNYEKLAKMIQGKLREIN